MSFIRFYTTIRMALRALRRNTMRSILTSLGIIIGVGAVIAMVSIGNGAKQIVKESIASLGDNLLIIGPGSVTTAGVRSGAGGGQTLIPADADQIVKDFKDSGSGAINVSPEVAGGRGQILANGLNWQASTMKGVGPDFPDLRNWRVKEGVFFSEADVETLAKVVVLGKTVVDNLFPDESPINQNVRISGVIFKVIGVMDQKGYSQNLDQDDIILMPYSSNMKRISRRTSLSTIYVQAKDEDTLPRLQQDIKELLIQRHGTEDFSVKTQEEIAAAQTAATDTMTYLLGAIAGVSLVVGGIGIMNIMLVSVTERTREIGIRMALGAHGKDVLTQFLVEAILLSSLGGMLGVALGIGGSELLGRYKNWPVEPSTSAMVIAVAFSATVGVFFGFYPARKAAQLDPIEALRYE